MSAGIELYNNVLNQLGSPALYSDIFANRPAFGFTGRLFISTDTLEIYRDTGTAWQLLSSGGGGVNIYNSNGSLTAARTMTMSGFPLTFSGGATAATLNVNADNNVNRQIKYQTGGVDRWEWLVSGNETGTANAGSDISLRAYNDAGVYINPALTIRRGTSKYELYSNEAFTAGGSVGYVGYYMSGQATYVGALSITGNPQGSIYNLFTFTNNGSPTFAASNIVSALSNVTRISGSVGGTVTLTQAAGGVRAFSNINSYTQFSLTANATITHYAGFNALGVDDIAATGGILTLTNAYQVLINSLDEYGEVAAGTLVMTNRWGIYQVAALDTNYLNGNTLIGSTTSTGEKLQVTGTARVTQSAYFATASGSMGIGTTSPAATLDVRGANFLANFQANSGFTKILVKDSTGVYQSVFGADAGGGNQYGFVGTESNHSFAIRTNNTERMRITAGGNVLIGTSTDGGETLQVVSSAMAGRLTTAANGSNILNLSNTAATFNSTGLQISTTRARNGAFNMLYCVANGTTEPVFIIQGTGNVGINTTSWGTSATATLSIATGTAPGSSPADCFQLYSADITAGNAAAHFRTENGAIVKIYQETTAVGSATFSSPGAGSAVKTDDTFDGYTLQQVVKALRNQGILA